MIGDARDRRRGHRRVLAAGATNGTDRARRAEPRTPCLGEEAGTGPAHLLLGFDEPLDLRWVLLHVLEETAHHAGHADATREMLDGSKMRG